MHYAEAIRPAGAREREGSQTVGGAGLEDAFRLEEADGRMQPVQDLDLGAAGVVRQEQVRAFFWYMGMRARFGIGGKPERQPLRTPRSDGC
jgi:hypothetical protein